MTKDKSHCIRAVSVCVFDLFCEYNMKIDFSAKVAREGCFIQQPQTINCIGETNFNGCRIQIK
jgi:hypothetical protein